MANLNYFHMYGKVAYSDPFGMGFGFRVGGLRQVVGEQVKILNRLMLVPLVGNSIKHHLKVMGLVHRFCTYIIFVCMLRFSRDINFLIFVIIF